METLPPHTHSVVRFGCQMSFRAQCKVHYWERDGMWQSSISSYIFILGDCGRNTCKLMFMLCFRHIILVVFIRLCDCLSPQMERRMGNKVTPVALMLQLRSWGSWLWGSARHSHADTSPWEDTCSCTGSPAWGVQPSQEVKRGWEMLNKEKGWYGEGVPICSWSPQSPLPCLFPGLSQERRQPTVTQASPQDTLCVEAPTEAWTHGGMPVRTIWEWRSPVMGYLGPGPKGK